MAGVLTRSPKRLSADPPPPGPDRPHGRGGGGDWALLTIAKTAWIAYVIQGRLTQEGIESVLDGANGFPGAWLHPFGDQTLPVRVLVHRWDLSAASLMLHEVDMPAPPTPPAAGDHAAAGGVTHIRRSRASRTLRVLAGIAVVMMAAAALSELVVLGPCISHWFCV
ncbi:MAG: hypothetical protein ACRDJU_02430 [Actinomycetota bacterium]